MSDDQAWLNSHAFLSFLGPRITAEDIRHGARSVGEHGLRGIVVSPSHVVATTELSASSPSDGPLVAAVVGFPTGRHHSLVKAAEARLAVAEGAEEVWLTPDAAVDDANMLLAEFVAVREAVPSPVQLAVILETPGRNEEQINTVAKAARLAGIDRLVSATGWLGTSDVVPALPKELGLPITAVGARNLSEVISQLELGADRVAVADLSALFDG